MDLPMEHMHSDAESQRSVKGQPSPFAEFNNGGYPRLANLMGTYGDLAIFRKFGALNSFILLSLQAELAKLEIMLQHDLQQSENSTDPTVQQFTKNFEKLRTYAQQSNAKEHSEKQHESEQDFALRINNTIDQITSKLDRYNRMVIQLSQISSLRTPRKVDIKYLREWLDGGNHGEGNHFLSSFERRTWEKEFTEDLLVMDTSNDDKDIFSRDISVVVIQAAEFLGLRRFKKPIDESGTVEYSEFKKTMRVLTTTLAAILPAVSILALYYCHTMPLRIGVMITITFGFSVILSLFTSAKRIEIFSATAAFAAVEVVFIGSATLSQN